MATRFERFRAHFPGRRCPLSGGSHSHLACIAMKLITLLLLGVGALALTSTGARADSFVELDYNIFNTASRLRNTVFLQLFDVDRPTTTANFLQYVNSGAYNNSLMHNLTVNPGVLLGGGYYPSYVTEPAPNYVSLNPAAKVDLDGNPLTLNPTIANEFSNSPLRSNVKGTIAMYHASGGLASNQFFLNLIDNSQTLDGSTGQAVFGQVVGDGMSLIDIYANQLTLLDLNPDADDNGTREDIGNPFGAVPVVVNQQAGTFLPLVLNSAKSVDYLGNGLTTTVPQSGLTFSNKDAFIDTGAVFAGTGSLTVASGRTLGIREDYILTQSLINHGTVAPGLSLGAVGVTAPYFQFSDGMLAIQLAGTTVDTQYDRFSTNNTAFLAGRLQVSLLNGFVPAIGNSFIVLTAQSIVGSFSSFDLPQLPAGRLWNISQSATAVTLTITNDAADFNKDGVVDARDYVYWRKTNGSAADYQLWRSSLADRSGGVFGAGTSDLGGGLVSGSVPEPSCGLLVLSALFLINGVSRRGQRVRQ
jgi:cyclophilin family peptidyl-prolyl cis-trans isomerase